MKRRLFVALCLTLTALFAGLGVWQIERRAWKLDLIDRVERRIHAAPVAPPEGWRDDMAYTRVTVAGRYRHDRETLVQAVTERGPGWWVMTPLVTGTRTILINRGFVPAAYRDPATRPAPDRATVSGLLRASEPGGGFLRSNDPAAGRWYSRDIAAIAAARGLGNAAPYFIDAGASRGYPVGGLTVVAFRNTHLVYALTWFALAGLSAFGAWLLLRRNGER